MILSCKPQSPLLTLITGQTPGAIPEAGVHPGTGGVMDPGAIPGTGVDPGTTTMAGVGPGVDFGRDSSEWTLQGTLG